MGKVLLGGFAASFGLAALVGGSAPSAPAMNPALVTQAKKAVNAAHRTLVMDDDGVYVLSAPAAAPKTEPLPAGLATSGH